MTTILNNPRSLALLALVGAATATGLAAQTQPQPRPLPAPTISEQDGVNTTTVYGELPSLSEMEEGPRVSGIITARKGSRLQVTADNGTVQLVTLHPDTEIRTRGGFLGIGNKTLDQSALINGLSVVVKTTRYGEGLVASEVRFTADDAQIARMIRGGTQQQFGEQGAAIQANAAATEALRGRLGDIDKYNLKSTTNVYFDTGKAVISPAAKAELCAAAQQAAQNENSLMLVLG